MTYVLSPKQGCAREERSCRRGGVHGTERLYEEVWFRTGLMEGKYHVAVTARLTTSWPTKKAKSN